MIDVKIEVKMMHIWKFFANKVMNDENRTFCCFL